MVHLPMMAYAALPTFHLFTLAIPDEPGLIFYTEHSRLPPYWRTGTSDETQSIFADWLIDPFSLALAVPSVIMDLSYNVLLHPDHPAFDQIAVVDQMILPVDQRLWRYETQMGK
ncbi:RES family NAD+ phosphorylase [Fibrella sp. HMF5335]|uniref:RES family NAD+ phosphorylase n=1 Tax=Fibrella rubiginis TaxID=2817060 RepID=A0A939GEP9_9BACT|nr:RES family NAD+ phosphorylase [Fibrella rubiginis]MBO0935346.1 RES family NAD+ phosphorylase [Fibrella rubiginis]